MSKKHFVVAAGIVRAILDGHWTDDTPTWANPRALSIAFVAGDDSGYTRAVQTAEAFIKLFHEFNPLFDETRFLVACGLVDTPAKTRKRT